MSEVTRKVCDLCGTEEPLKYTGLVLGYGFSRGGWGRRQDYANWSGEVCKDCFNRAVSMHNQMAKSFLSREVKFYVVRFPDLIMKILRMIIPDKVYEVKP